MSQSAPGGAPGPGPESGPGPDRGSGAGPGTILLAGASRGLGLGLAREYLGRGWSVVATARRPQESGLAGLADPRLRVEQLDVTDRASVAALSRALEGVAFDVIFIVAGVSQHFGAAAHDVPPEDACREFLTNAWGPVMAAEALLPRLAPGGTVALMSSVLGSVALNTGGGSEIYRATKAALNTLGRSFAGRHPGLPVLLLHPGWVRTDMGGSRAPLDVETSARGLADVIAGHAETPGAAFLDYQGNTLPW